MAAGEPLATAVGSASAVLLDFDGPVCAVFSGVPAARVAAELRCLARDHGVHVEDDERTAGDPLAVLRLIADRYPSLVGSMDAALRQAELTAVRTATPTPGADRFLAACRAVALPVAIVSNNGADAIRTYLDRLDLSSLVHSVHGRPRAHPERMKPDPYLVQRALDALRTDASSAVLVGDSVTDVQAARRVGVRAIGLANKPGKHASLAVADAVVTSMYALTEPATA